MLTPSDGGTPIRLVARTQFSIGRSRAEADLVARFLPETSENATRTHELGRVHVLGEIIGGVPALRDGNGTQPSANGSTFDARPLNANSPTALRQRGVLDLAGRFAFEVIPHLAAGEDFAVENLAAWKMGAARAGGGGGWETAVPWGCCFFCGAGGAGVCARGGVVVHARGFFPRGKRRAGLAAAVAKQSRGIASHRRLLLDRECGAARRRSPIGPDNPHAERSRAARQGSFPPAEGAGVFERDRMSKPGAAAASPRFFPRVCGMGRAH